MKDRYYKLPLDLGGICNQNELPASGLKPSIAQYIHLIATTFMGESKYDPSFGCSVWEVDFDNASTNNELKENLKKSLTDAIHNYEKRIINFNVSVEIRQSELSTLVHRIKKRIDITVKGKLATTNEPFEYYEYFYIGPLSYY